MSTAPAHVAQWQHQLPDVPVALPCANGTGVLVSADGSAVAVDLASGDVRAARAFAGGALGAALDPSGSRALVHGPFGAALWQIDSDTVEPIADGPWCGAARWAGPDRAAVAVGRRVVVLDAAGTPLWTSQVLPSTVTAVAWLGGWRRLAAAAYGGVHVLEPRPGGSAVLNPFRGSLLTLDSTPNGRWIVSGNQDATLQVFRSDKDTRLEMEGYPGKITQVSFDRSGRFLANNGADDITVWDFSGPGPRGRAPAMLVGEEEATPVDFCWHPDHPRLAVAWAGGEVLQYDVADALPGQRTAATSELWRADSAPAVLAWPGAGLVLVADVDGRVDAVPVDAVPVDPA
jgi:WD40 repeat protein